MKKLKFLITVPDKYTRIQYEAGTIYEFEDTRAEEILNAKTAVTREPYAIEIVETVENIVETEQVIEQVTEQVEKPKRKRMEIKTRGETI